MTETPNLQPLHWVALNRWAYMGVQGQQIVAVAYWVPEGPAMQTDDANSEEPVIGEAWYVLVRADDAASGKWFAGGPEPKDDWSEELLQRADRLFREWAHWPLGLEEEAS